MSVFTLEMEIDNAAFEETPEEIARILRDVADRVNDGHTDGLLVDFNGNRVGTFSTLAEAEL